MEVTKNPLIKKVSKIHNLIYKDSSSIIKIKQDIKSMQSNKFLLNDVLHKNKKPIYLISQRNSKKKDKEKPNQMFSGDTTDRYTKDTKDIIMKKCMTKAFSHKNIDKKDNSSINPSKLSVNKKYKIIKNNNINTNIEIHDYEYTNHMNDKPINVNTFSQNNLNINNIVESLSNNNIQINKRNSLKNIKNLTFNHNKNNSNNIISDNLNKNKYKNIINKRIKEFNQIFSCILLGL